MDDKPRPFRVEIRVDAPRDEVWRAVRDPDRIREWFGWDYESIGPEIQLIFVDGPADRGAIRAGERLDFGEGSYLELVADGATTVVRVIRPGPLDDTGWDEIYDGVGEGWRMFLEQLRFLLETRPAGRRRTVFLAGQATAAAARAAVAGDGPVWFDHPRHWMRVDPAGHLVALATQEPSTSDTPGPVSVTVSTYGLDDAAFAAVRDEWAGRWGGIDEGTLTTAEEEATRLG
jgi:uncharacterized protein YndB with AHSA1/START domain